MDKETLRKVQLAQLEIAIEIRRVCDENNIRYFLDFGSLLGAVRHQGFIPWDDDMDIGMLREDYERFCDIAPKALSDQYYLQTWDLDEYYPNAFAKVRKRGTRFVEVVCQGKNASHELYVDIFPYDFFCEKGIRLRQLQIKVIKPILFMCADYKIWVRGENKFHCALIYLKYFPFFLLSKVASFNRLKARYQTILTKFNSCATDNITVAGAGPYGIKFIPKKCVDSLTTILFEGVPFSCSADYDLILRRYYGDYMQLPPEDQRENRHGIIEVNL